MRSTSDVLRALGLPARDAYDLPTSHRRFADGDQYRVEIPSVEGPKALEGVLQAAEHGVPVHRVSQGSGILLQTDDETRRMVALGRNARIEVCLFVGPRAAWDRAYKRPARWAASWAPRCAARTSWRTASRTCGTGAPWACARSSSRTSASWWCSGA